MTFAASDDPTFPRFWFLTIDDDVIDEDIPGINREEISDFIEDVLLHPMGWLSHGYTFIQCTPEEGLRVRSNHKNKKFVLHLRMSRPETIKKQCNFGGLSCADLAQNIVYFNLDRWLHGSIESSLSLPAYRVYVVCHEVGHLLNRRHNKCGKKDGACPVMYQQTISKGCCKPNPWPLAWE